MLSDAIRDIQKASDSEAARRRDSESRRDVKRRIDGLMHQVEDLLEHDQGVTPERLATDIAGFLRPLDARLHESVLRDKSAVHVLDVLFEAQEELQPAHADPLEISA